MKNKFLINIVLIFICLQGILDMLVTVLPNYPISLIIRGLFLVLVVLYLLYKKINIKITISLIFLMMSYILYSYFNLNYSVVESISVSFKLFYLLFTIIFLNDLDIEKKLNKVLVISLIIYIFIYLSSYILDIGYNNYLETDGKSGYRGLFNSINEFSAITVLLYYYAFNYLKNNKIRLIVLSILLFLISFLAGTKVLTIGLILVCFLNLYKIIFKKFKENSLKKKIVFSLISFIIIILITIVFMKTNTYKNMLVQADFFKVNNIFSGDFINRILFNDRLTFLSTNNTYFLEQGFITKLIGIGYNSSLKLVEIDIFDILYRYGVIGLAMIVFVFSYFIKKSKLNRFNLKALLLLIFISLTSGHVLLCPSVSIYFGIIFMINKNNKYLKE